MEISFNNLRCKDVVNVCDGKNLGNITDIIFDTCCGKIIGIIVPSNKSFFSFFKHNNELFIPYNHICKIGKDIILVDIIMQDECESNNQINHHVNTLKEINNSKTIEKLNIQSLLNKENTNQG